MTKSIEPKKLVVMIMKIIVVIVVVVVLWCFYSLIRFDGIYSPAYVFGLSDPYRYYQEHIGLVLLENGAEYKMEPTINEKDSETYKVYENKEHNFRFKYSKDFDISVNSNAFYNDNGTEIKFFNKNNSVTVCHVYVKYKGWGVGANWLPKKRRFIENQINNKQGEKYIITKHRQIVSALSASDPNREIFNTKYVQIAYVDKKNNLVLDVVIGGKKCIDNIVSTFEFIE